MKSDKKDEASSSRATMQERAGMSGICCAGNGDKTGVSSRGVFMAAVKMASTNKVDLNLECFLLDQSYLATK